MATRSEIIVKERRQAKVAEMLRLSPFTSQTQIAAELKVDKATIARDVDAIRQQWAERSDEDADVLFGQLSDTLKHVATEALRMWAVSCLPSVDRVRYTDKAAGLTIKDSIVEGQLRHTEVRKLAGRGNVQYLNAALKACDQLAKLHDLYPAKGADVAVNITAVLQQIRDEDEIIREYGDDIEAITQAITAQWEAEQQAARTEQPG